MSSPDPTITEATLTTALLTRLNATHVQVTDMSGGCGQSFTAHVVSPSFAGLSSLKRNRALHAALRDEIARIHAWSAKCQTPEEWARDRAKEADAGPPLDGTVEGKVDGVSS